MRRPSGQCRLRMARAVPGRSLAVALLHEDPAVFIRQKASERMIPVLSGPDGDLDRPPQQFDILVMRQFGKPFIVIPDFNFFLSRLLAFDLVVN